MTQIQIRRNALMVQVPARSDACFKMAGALTVLGLLLLAFDR